mmetsp:Transcript_3773/g.2974  ORF Transcript_3773/g.2974 Transcript_3773/m.2974 type:complete len:93 (-) Transcript_3773:130-408(-)
MPSPSLSSWPRAFDSQHPRDECGQRHWREAWQRGLALGNALGEGYNSWRKKKKKKKKNTVMPLRSERSVAILAQEPQANHAIPQPLLVAPRV